jgi:hypothetical protein
MRRGWQRPRHNDFKVNFQAQDQDLQQAQGSLLTRTFPRPRPARRRGRYRTARVD